MENDTIRSTSPVYTLSTASSLSGIPIHSIRQYIDRGLIVPFTKESKRHLFSKVDIIRLKYINNLLNIGGLNIAGIRKLLALIPCWAIRKCKENDRKNCLAYSATEYPCWDASEKGISCRNANCRECEVYGVIERYPDLKSFFKTIIK